MSEVKVDFKAAFQAATLPELLDAQKLLDQEIVSRKRLPTKLDHVITYTDGAARGNPGPAGVGVLIFAPNDEKILQDYQYLGECTNNEAEYRALLLALDRALEITQQRVECYMDSELLVRQLNGQYQIKSEKLLKFYNEVKARIARFEKATFTHVPREHPMLRIADALANRAIDEVRPKRGAKINF